MKFRRLFAILPLIIAAVCASCSPDGAENGNMVASRRTVLSDDTNWPSFRGNPASTGVAESLPVETLSLVWMRKAGSKHLTSAVVAEGMVFIGADASGLIALDLFSGEILWTLKTPAPISAAPCVHDGRVFVGDMDGTFHAVDARTGTHIWSEMSDRQIIAPANIFGGDVVVGSDDGFLYCFAQEDGTLNWKVETDNFVQGGSAVLDEAVAIAGCDGVLRIIAQKTGENTVSMELNAHVASTVAFRNGRLFVTVYEGRVLALDPVAKQTVWEWEAPDGARFSASPAVSDEMVVIVADNGGVWGLNAETGERKWGYLARGKITSSPVIWGEKVYFGSHDGHIYGLNLGDGKQVWRFNAGAAVAASPAVAARRLIISAEDGSIYCFGQRAR